MTIKVKRKIPTGNKIAQHILQSPFAVVYKGKPFYDPARDGITFSLLSTWIDCREKARLYLQGWTAQQTWTATTFGSIVHGILERIYEQIRLGKITKIPSAKLVKKYTDEIIIEWEKENPKADADTRNDMEFTAMLAEHTLPLYFQYWYKDFEELQWDALESTFKIPITVTSLGSQIKRTTFLRGKIDGLFRFSKKPTVQRLLETKTRAHIDAGAIADVLPYELQVNIYMTAVRDKTKKDPGGVLYNLIRRPQLRQKQSETLLQFAERITKDIQMRPDFYFVRMELKVLAIDLAEFRKSLDQLVGDFLDWWHGRQGHYKESPHCQTRYGSCPMLPICGKNDYSRHYQRDTVFRELEEF